MARKSYSNEQRRVAAASFYKMSMEIREKRKAAKIDRDIFIILARVYIAHHAGETVNVAQLVEPVGKNWGAVKVKLDGLQGRGLLKLEDHPADGRSFNVVAQPALFEYFESILDELMYTMCMSVECIKRHGAKSRPRPEDTEVFCREISAFCRLEMVAHNAKNVR